MAGNLKTNSVQLGDSATATQNFVLQTNVDGTAKLARGNLGATTQDILTVDASGKVAFPATTNTQLGIGQTWQDVKASRVPGTTYTNSTEKPIAIAIVGTNGGTGGTLGLVVGGLLVSRMAAYTGGATVSVFGVVPPGITYATNSTVGSVTVESWSELR